MKNLAYCIFLLSFNAMADTSTIQTQLTDQQCQEVRVDGTWSYQSERKTGTMALFNNNAVLSWFVVDKKGKITTRTASYSVQKNGCFIKFVGDNIVNMTVTKAEYDQDGVLRAIEARNNCSTISSVIMYY